MEKVSDLWTAYQSLNEKVEGVPDPNQEINARLSERRTGFKIIEISGSDSDSEDDE